MTLDLTKPLQLRDYPEYTDVTYLGSGGSCPMAFAFKGRNGNWGTFGRFADGKYVNNSTVDHPFDIINAKVKSSKFRNVYQNDANGHVHDSLRAAVTGGIAGREYIAEGVLEYQYEDGVLVKKVFHDIPKNAIPEDY